MTLFPPEMRLSPWPMYAMMRESSPVLYYPDYDVWLVFRYEDVRLVLSDHRRFSSQYGDAVPGAERRRAGGTHPFADAMITSDPPRHSQLRGLVSKAFTPRAVAEMEPRIRQLTAELLRGAAQSGEMDVIRDLAEPLPVVVIAEMLGVPPEDRAMFKAWSDLVVASSDQFVSGREETPEQRAAVREMMDYFRQAIARRRTEPGEDLISGLLAAEIDGQRLTEAEVLSFCWLLLVAGNETTTNLIGNAALTLAEHLEALARLRAEPHLIPSAVEEVLRYRSPVQAMFRVAAADVELGGQQIRAGQRVVAFLGSANRDPERFPEPDRFDIAREPNPHIAFGHGIHFCLGAPLARLEGRIALEAMLELGPWRLPEGLELEPVEGLIVHGVKRLPVRFERG